MAHIGSAPSIWLNRSSQYQNNEVVHISVNDLFCQVCEKA